jgi:hypothetical protein
MWTFKSNRPKKELPSFKYTPPLLIDGIYMRRELYAIKNQLTLAKDELEHKKVDKNLMSDLIIESINRIDKLIKTT